MTRQEIWDLEEKIRSALASKSKEELDKINQDLQEWISKL